MKGTEFGQMSPLMKVLVILGLMLLGAILIPALVGLVSSIPDIARYVQIKRM